MPKEFEGQKVVGDHCLRCDKDVEWKPIPDSLAEYCVECGFVRVETGEVGHGGGAVYDAGATIQEWLEDISGSKKE